MKILSW